MAPTRPLRIAALVKQVPVAETLSLSPDGRLRREGNELEMNPYCRRAVSKGVELAAESGGTCIVVTLGPPQAEDVLREAIAWGADSGLHLCDPGLAGSDTLVTARAVVAAIHEAGPFDLILLGRNTIDGETGQVGPEVAQLLDLPFACGARSLTLGNERLGLELELDDGLETVDIDLPAVVSVAERLCDPCKVGPAGRASVAPNRIRRLAVSDLGAGPWGDAGSPTQVGDVRSMMHERAHRVLGGPVEDQVKEAIEILIGRDALRVAGQGGKRAEPPPERTPHESTTGRPIVVLVEPGRIQMARELIGGASRIAAQVDTTVSVLSAGGLNWDDLAGAGADAILELEGSSVAEDVAEALIDLVKEHSPWVVLAPSTAFGREVAGRAAAATGSGLIGDAIALEVLDSRLVAAKPAFAGALVADITCRSAVQFVTLRPGILPLPPVDASKHATIFHLTLVPKGRIRTEVRQRNDDIEVLARAEVVIGVGTGVGPDEYSRLSALAAILGAELAATRKVTDKGWAPRSRQVGITGRSIAPRLYVALALSGKFNHMAGVRSAGTVLAINNDPDAVVFEHCDVGIVADWRDVVPSLEEGLREATRQQENASAPN